MFSHPYISVFHFLVNGFSVINHTNGAGRLGYWLRLKHDTHSIGPFIPAERMSMATIIPARLIGRDHFPEPTWKKLDWHLCSYRPLKIKQSAYHWCSCKVTQCIYSVSKTTIYTKLYILLLAIATSFLFSPSTCNIIIVITNMPVPIYTSE